MDSNKNKCKQCRGTLYVVQPDGILPGVKCLPCHLRDTENAISAISTKIVSALIADLGDRREIGDILDSIDGNVQTEMHEELVSLVKEEIAIFLNDMA